MPATPESEARTRAFARVIGPFLVIVPGIIAARAPDTGVQLSAFFENAALVWITGGLLVFAGLFIIANHQYWSSASAILISLFGWFLAVWVRMRREERYLQSEFGPEYEDFMRRHSRLLPGIY